jgi:hypothetical protein
MKVLLEKLQQLDPTTMDASSEKRKAKEYLESLINKTFHILVTDGRLFVGTFKCTDTVGSPALHTLTQPIGNLNSLI